MGLSAFAFIISSLNAGQIAPPPTPDTLCLYPPNRRNVTALSNEAFRQGATIGIRPQRDAMPAGYRDLPAECLSDWSVEGPADFSSDHRSITIRPDAPPGAEIVVRYKVRGEPMLVRLRVIARDARVLTGRWGQKAAEGCESLEPVRELELTAEDFTVTFAPFESYRDYWGRYSFDAQTGALHMTVTGGNNIPHGLDLEGTARLEDGHLVLDGMFLGDRGASVPAGGCRYRF